jgi:hypothetical protein
VKNTPTLTLALVAACTLSGCDDYQIADKSKEQVADKSKEVVISKAEYDALKAEAAQAKQVGRYQLHREGSRTWRLDTATGRHCLLLTTQYDWDHEGAKQTSCDTDDWQAAQERHRLYPSLYDQYGNPIPQK